VPSENGIKPAPDRPSSWRTFLTPRQAPNDNTFAERFVLSIKSECLNRMMFFGEGSLRRAVTAYLAHDHAERAHQGLETRSSRPSNLDMATSGVASGWVESSSTTTGPHDMGLLNRCAVIIKPRTPYLEWTGQDDAEGLAKPVFESLRNASQRAGEVALTVGSTHPAFC
jgi:hypothetical protein